MLDVLKEPNNPTYSLFIPFTREWMVEDFLNSLDGMKVPLSETEFVFYNDTDNRSLQWILTDYLNEKLPYINGAKVYMSGNRAPTEIDVNIRRERIVAMKNKSKDLIADSKFVFCLEDDTFVSDPDALSKLITQISSDETIGFVSGVERGRWGFGIIGAWKMDDYTNPSWVSTLPYKETGIEEVDGAGWYFYVTRTPLYKQADYRFEAECLGPDVCYVMDVRRQGYRCLVDWSIPCGHRHGSITLYPAHDCIVVEWAKTDNGWAIVGTH